MLLKIQPKGNWGGWKLSRDETIRPFFLKYRKRNEAKCLIWLTYFYEIHVSISPNTKWHVSSYPSLEFLGDFKYATNSLESFKAAETSMRPAYHSGEINSIYISFYDPLLIFTVRFQNSILIPKTISKTNWITHISCKNYTNVAQAFYHIQNSAAYSWFCNNDNNSNAQPCCCFNMNYCTYFECELGMSPCKRINCCCVKF